MFTIIKEAGWWVIRAKNGHLLTVTGPQDNAPIILSPKSGQDNQKFNIQEHPGSKDHVIYTCYGKVLDVLGEHKENGSKIGQYNFTGGKNQLWNFCDPKNITSSSSDNDWDQIVVYLALKVKTTNFMSSSPNIYWKIVNISILFKNV